LRRATRKSGGTTLREVDLGALTGEADLDFWPGFFFFWRVSLSPPTGFPRERRASFFLHRTRTARGTGFRVTRKRAIDVSGTAATSGPRSRHRTDGRIYDRGRTGRVWPRLFFTDTLAETNTLRIARLFILDLIRARICPLLGARRPTRPLHVDRTRGQARPQSCGLHASTTCTTPPR